MSLVPIFDLDGTLLDSDAALVAPFVALGVPAEDVTFGALLADECARLGVTVDDYLARYDEAAAMPFEGVDEPWSLELDRWAVCSNKHTASGHVPSSSVWAGSPRSRCSPMRSVDRSDSDRCSTSLDADAGDVVFVGDTDHDRRCAAAVGCRFALATWNPRARDSPAGPDIVLRTPG